MITILNLPSNVRTLHGSILLCGIIPGKSEPKSLDAYIAVLVDEIVGLNNRDFFDAYQNEKFKLKIDILLHILDYHGQSKLFRISLCDELTMTFDPSQRQCLQLAVATRPLTATHPIIVRNNVARIIIIGYESNTIMSGSVSPVNCGGVIHILLSVEMIAS